MKTSYVNIIINPVAGHGKAGRMARTLLHMIKKSSDFEINICFSREKDDATVITRNAVKDGASMVIAVGGDGTVNEVVNGFFDEGKAINPLCELGIINCGTGGGYSKTLKYPAAMDKQIENILRPGSSALDLGKVSWLDDSDKIISRYFVNECQIGVGSKVASMVGRKSKIFGGTIAFGTAATISAMLMKAIPVTVGFDDGNFSELDLLGLVVGNGTECAGGMKLTPHAKLDDGMFDVLLMKKMTIVQRMVNLSKVYSGTHIMSPYFSITKCKKIMIRSENPIALESDGEILGNSPFDIEIIPSAIRVKANCN
jgi:diacylglycerol kinase (ATP)